MEKLFKLVVIKAGLFAAEKVAEAVVGKEITESPVGKCVKAVTEIVVHLVADSDE